MPLKLTHELTGHTDRIWTLAWAPDGILLASSGGDKTIRLWASIEDKWVCVSVLTETHSKSIRRLCWSPCGQYLASASFDSTVCIWKRNPIDKTWSIVVNLEGHENEVKSVAWSHDGAYLASCGRDKTIWIWERAETDDSDQEDAEDHESWDCSDVKNDHTKDVKQIVWHPNHNILVSCSYDDTVKLFHKDNDEWKCYETLDSHSSTVWSADFSASGEYLVTCSDDKTVKIWKNHAHNKLPSVEAKSWKCLSVIQGYHSRTIYDVSWCKLNDIIVSASGDNSLVLYARSPDTSNDEEMFACIDKLSQSHECDVNCVAWNPKRSGVLASGGDDNSIRLWRYSSQEKGMKPMTVVEEILQSLPELKPKSEFTAHSGENLISEFNTTVTDFSILLNLVQSLQNLQSSINGNDSERHSLETLLDLKITKSDPEPIELSNLCFDEKDGSIDNFSVGIIDEQGKIRYKFAVGFDRSKFALRIPKRSSKLLAVANELFLFEKTGDMFKIQDSGESQFLLGHLFTFADVKVVTRKNEREISYIISTDRDEKIRISNYPDTFRIERFGFGHKYFVRRLILVDEERFISIDQSNNVCLWNLSSLSQSPSEKPLTPTRAIRLNESIAKHKCLRVSLEADSK